jgi:hypothetical protein
MFEVRRETAVEDMTGFCVYDGDPPPAYLRGCPGGGGLGIGYIGLTRTPTRTRSWGSYGSLGEGTYAAGEYYDVTGSAADPHGVIAVVTYPSGWDL